MVWTGGTADLLPPVPPAPARLLGNLFGWIGGQPPSWAVAGVTLVVAALSSRSGIASSRSLTVASTGTSHDAARTIETFATRLRDELDLTASVRQQLGQTPAQLRRCCGGSPGR
jgi:hypothetical protein